jgi:MFS family permease
MKLKRNVPLMYVIGVLMWGRFFIPVIALFYVASQVSLSQFALIMGVFSLSTLLFEIPTGAFADLIGKKNTLLLSRFMYIIEIFLIAFFNGFWIFLVAKIVSGIGVSLSSGTGSAMLFDTLKKQRREDQHKKISGKISVVTNISMAIVFIIGAYLFSLSPKLPAILSLPFIISGFLLTFFLEEPYRQTKKFNMKNYFRHLKESFVFFKRSKVLKYLSFFSLFSAAAISIILSMSSAYFERILIPVSLIGVLAFFASMIMAFTSKKADAWENKVGEKYSLFFIQFILVIGIFAMSLMIPIWGYLFYLLIPFVSGFSGVVLGDYANKHIDSSHRATILSMQNIFSSLGIFLLFPFIGNLVESKGFGNSFLILGLIIFGGFLGLYLFSRKWNLKFNDVEASK